MHHVTGIDRNQTQIISLEQMVEEESFARVIDAFVDMLDLESFGFTYYKLNKEGRPPFHPSTMMKIYLYGYQNSIRSCRRLEKACRTNIEMMWLINQQYPHYKTIANFRKDNPKPFKEVFRYFVALLKDWQLIDGKAIAIDSFKIRAQNSLKNNFNGRKVKRHLEYIDNKIEEYEKCLDEEPDQEIKDKLDHNQKKKQNYQRIKQNLKDSGDGQISTTDPDSKAVVFQRNSVKVGYNIQAASDGKHKLLIAADTGDVNDTKALAVMVNKVQNNLGSLQQGIRTDVLADKGYHSGRELKACEELNVNSFVSPKQSSSSKANPDFAMNKFHYNEQDDTYTCPANEIMQTNGRWYNKSLKDGRKSYHVKHYKTKACKNCSFRTQCTSNKMGRFIERTEYAQYVFKNNQRVNKNPEYYRQRQQIIEHQFGTLKRHQHFDYTLLRGKQKVLSEVYLMFTTYNLRRSMSILGFPELIKRLKALFPQIFKKRLPTQLLDLDNMVKILIHSMRHRAWGGKIQDIWGS
jgi:transposase